MYTTVLKYSPFAHFFTLLSNTKDGSDIFYLFPDYSSKEFSQGRKPSPENRIGRERKSRSLKKHLTNMSSEMEAEMEGLSLGEGSSQEDWENLFRKVPEARAIILDSVDLESALACRLVCKEWRKTVNYCRKLWTKINKVCSTALYVFILSCQDWTH